MNDLPITIKFVSGISGWLQHLLCGLVGHQGEGGVLVLLQAVETHGEVPAPGQHSSHTLLSLTL